jgi:transcriptional regulator with XRE-family HTH domain
VELRLKLADALKRQRMRRNLTQADLTMAMKSSQSRVAKQESGVMPAIVLAKEKGKT